MNKRNNFSNYLAVCAGTRFWSCVNLLVCGILLAEIFHTFKILFKIKYTRDNDMPSALTISQSCICNHFKIFPWHLRHCLACQCYSHRSVRFLTSLTDSLRVGNFFLSFFLSYELSLYDISDNLFNSPQFSKNLHYRKIEFSSHLLNRLLFLQYFQPVSPPFIPHAFNSIKEWWFIWNNILEKTFNSLN